MEPAINSQIPQIHDPAKEQRLKNIISDISDNKCHEIVMNRSVYEKSGESLYFNKNDVPPMFAADAMVKWGKGVVLSNLDLGECDTNLIHNLCLCLESNSTLEKLIICDDPTISNGKLANIQEISEAISKNKSLKNLFLSNNNLGNADPKIIELFFGTIIKNESLLELILENNNLSNGNAKSIELIFEAINKNQTILSLNLGNNNLGGGSQELIQVIFDLISKNESIQELTLERNNLGKGITKNIEMIFDAVNKNGKITSLQLKNNNLGDGDEKIVDLIFDLISKNEKIDYLELNGNNWIRGTVQMGKLFETKSKRSEIYWSVNLNF